MEVAKALRNRSGGGKVPGRGVRGCLIQRFSQDCEIWYPVWEEPYEAQEG